MKLVHKYFMVWKDDIYIIPTINIGINSVIYRKPNFSIMFHWLVFHAKVLFMEVPE